MINFNYNQKTPKVQDAHSLLSNQAEYCLLQLAVLFLFKAKQAKGKDSKLRRDLEETIFSTPIGSYLHGLATPDSDHDTWIITRESNSSKRNGIHRDDTNDHYTVPLNTLVRLASNGNYTALDVMFSEQATPSWFDAFRKSFHVGLPAMSDGFVKTIRVNAQDPRSKFRRHAIRMALNFREAVGQIQPNFVIRKCRFRRICCYF